MGNASCATPPLRRWTKSPIGSAGPSRLVRSTPHKAPEAETEGNRIVEVSVPFCRLIIHPPCLSCAECRAAPAAEQRCQRALVTAGLAARGLGIQRPARGSPFAQHA